MNKLHQIMDTQMQDVRQEVFDEGQGVKLKNDRSDFISSECHIKEEPEDKHMLSSVYSELQDTSNAELHIHVDTKIQNRTEAVQIQKGKFENDESCLEKIDGTHCSDIYEVDSLNKNLDTGLRTVEQEEEDKHSLENVSSNSQGYDKIYIFENRESNCKDKNYILVETMAIKQEIQDLNQYGMYSALEDTSITPENNNSQVENSDITPENSFVNIQSYDLKSENEPRFMDEGDLNRTGKLFIRGKCDGKFRDSDTLSLNQPTKTTEQGTCNMSDKGLNSVESMRQHMGSHNIDSPHPGHSTERPFMCNVCGKRFKTPSCLRMHMTCHSTDRPHQCNVCGKRFKTPSCLRMHMTCHSTERPHECNHCGKTFKTMKVLRNHIACHSTERPHECNDCGKRFKTAARLRSHMICHITERPHQCNVCGKRFKMKKTLTTHMICHSTERPNQCNGKAFVNCTDKNDILVETMTIKQEVQDHFQYRMYSPLEDINVTTENNNSHVENSDLTLENSFVSIQSSDLKSEKEPRVLDEGDLSREKRGSLIDRYNANISTSCTNTEESISNITSTEVKIENNGFNADKCYVNGHDSYFENCGFGIEPMVFPIVTAGPSIAGPLNTLRSKSEAVWQPVVQLTRLPDTIFEDGPQVYKTTQKVCFPPEKRFTPEQLKSCDKNDWRISAKLSDQVYTEVCTKKFEKRNLWSRRIYQEKLFISVKGDGKFQDSDTLSLNEPTKTSEQGTCNMSNKGLNSVESMRQHMGSHNIDRPHQCNVCGKTLKTPSGLRCHMIFCSSTERPHQCNVCGKRFKTTAGLRRHIYIISPSTELSHQCDVCGKAFKSVSHLRSHQIIHSSLRPHQCDVCGKSFKAQRYLTLHQTSHRSVHPHQCDVCGKSFKSLRYLKLHQTSHSSVLPHQCDVCGKSFKSLRYLTLHQTSHSSVLPHQCDVCGKSFKSKSLVRGHKISHSTERPHECNVCGKAFKTLAVLKEHMTSHSTDRPHQCNVCGIAFKDFKAVKNHKISHSTERPHECNVCGKAFKDLRAVKKHQISHSTERPHECNVCGKAFKTLKSLTLHLMNHNTEQPHECNVCGKAFKTLAVLKEHMTSHSTERPHQCNVCGMAFKDLRAVTNHKITHSTERPHHCDVCDKAFKTLKILTVHLMNHSAERPHECNVCGERFKLSAYLKTHMTSHNTELLHPTSV